MNIEQHLFICGITGSGKTFFSAKLFKEMSGLRTFINVQTEQSVRNASQVIMTETTEYTQHIRKGIKRISLESPNYKRDPSPQEIEEIIDINFQIGKQVREGIVGRDFWSAIFFDEVHEYGGKEGFTPIRRVAKRGHRNGIRGIFISQRPADTDHSILTQCKQHIIFKLSDYENPYLKRYRIPIEKPLDEEIRPDNYILNEANRNYLWIQQEYHFIIWDGEKAVRYSPIEP